MNSGLFEDLFGLNFRTCITWLSTEWMPPFYDDAQNIPAVILASPVSHPCSVRHSFTRRDPAALCIAPSTVKFTRILRR